LYDGLNSRNSCPISPHQTLSTYPLHIGYNLQRIILRYRCGFAIALLALCGRLQAQDHAYYVAIKLHAGGTAIVGYLHSVNDSAVTIIPGKVSKRGLKAALANPRPISVPVELIKKVAVARVKTGAHVFLSSLLTATAYSVAYVLFIPVETTAGFVVYVAAVTTATLLTLSWIYVRKYKPTETAFTLKMQQYCLEKSIVVYGQ